MAEQTSEYWQERFKQMEDAQHDTYGQQERMCAFIMFHFVMDVVCGGKISNKISFL